MNIKELTEEVKKLTEDVEEENEAADLRRKHRVYIKAYESLEELQDILEESISPTTGELDEETNVFFDKITDMINEIYSRSLAFEGMY